MMPNLSAMDAAQKKSTKPHQKKNLAVKRIIRKKSRRVPHPTAMAMKKLPPKFNEIPNKLGDILEVHPNAGTPKAPEMKIL